MSQYYYQSVPDVGNGHAGRPILILVLFSDTWFKSVRGGGGGGNHSWDLQLIENLVLDQ